jgi:amino acid permease
MCVQVGLLIVFLINPRFLFYIISAFIVGLVVRSNDCRLGPSPLKNETSRVQKQYGSLVTFEGDITCFLPEGANFNKTNDASEGQRIIATSPFIIALRDLTHGNAILPSMANVAFILSAWSAATSDIYISSRYLFYLAECGQVPGAWIFRRIATSRYPEVKNWRIKLSPPDKLTYVPVASVLVASLFGCLSFMAATRNAFQVCHISCESTHRLTCEAGLSLVLVNDFGRCIAQLDRNDRNISSMVLRIRVSAIEREA